MLLNDEIASEPLATGEVERFRERIAARLDDASNESNHSETRLGLAYDAILNCALLALRVEGYRAKHRAGHHRIAIESLTETTGVECEDVAYYHDLSGMSSRCLYDATPVTEEDAAEAVAAARELLAKLDRWLKGRHA